MAFLVGQKVVCVDASGGTWIQEPTLTLGAVYTIRGFDLVDVPPEGPGIYLEEVRLPNYPARSRWPNTEIAYHRWRFRPAVERKTDISIFTKMLDGVRDDAPVT